MKPSSFAAAVPGLLLCSAVLLPFYDKAFTVDDVSFLLAAKHVLHDPLHPTAFNMAWGGMNVRVSTYMVNGPVMAYLLVPAVALGGRECIAHAFVFALAGVLVWATAALALRLGMAIREARRAALLVAATPAFLGMASTTMADVPAAAFAAVGMERLLAWRDDGRWHQCLLAAISLALGTMCRLQVAALLGIGAFVLILTRRRRRGWWSPFALSVLLIVSCITITRDPMPKRSIIDAAAAFTMSGSLQRNIVSFGVHLCVVMAFAVPWTVLRLRTLARKPAFWGSFAAAALLVLPLPRVPAISTTVLCGLGFAAVSDVLLDGARRMDRNQLLLGAWLIMGAGVVVYIHFPSKYLVPSAPAAALLLANALSSPEMRRPGWILGGTLAYGAALGLLIIRADAHLANFTRRATRELVAQAAVRGRTVWFSGDWGFHWYALEAGARPLFFQPPHPDEGDVVITAEVQSQRIGPAVIHSIPERRLLATLTDDAPGGRVASCEDGANFFSNYCSFLPWAWGSEPIERFYVWDIHRPKPGEPTPPRVLMQPRR